MLKPINFFSIPRSLTQDPLFYKLSLKHQKIFLTIIEHAIYKAQKLDDFGVIIELQPGQVLTTFRQIVEWCNCKEISKNDVERCVKKLIQLRFLGQEVRHKKSILTVLHEDTYNLIKHASETRSETNVRQTRDKLETEKNKENKENKENTSAKKRGGGGGVFFCRTQKKFVGLSNDQIERWKEIYPDVDLIREFGKMRDWLLDNSTYTGNTKFIRNWLSRVKPPQAKTIPIEQIGPDPKILKMFNNIRD